jgi:beta-1,4-mannosyl-glycoprotein beta-1,4-N-acetylglucosaminyltransferase
MKSRIFDCITFFRENFITNIRFEILNNLVDYFVVCESKFDHTGKKKSLNFKLHNCFFKKKIIYIVIDEPFPNNLKTGWARQAYQRDYMIYKIPNIQVNDYLFFSDPDEIPNPSKLKNFKLKKKYGIFLQKFYTYKFNIYNKYDSPWEGTRVCKFGDLKSINYMRQNILIKNLRKWWRPDKEKNIEVIQDGGWHFNNILSPKELSKKLKKFAHQEYNLDIFTNEKKIRQRLKARKDLYNKGKNFIRVKLDHTFPKYILKNRNKFKTFIA